MSAPAKAGAVESSLVSFALLDLPPAVTGSGPTDLVAMLATAASAATAGASSECDDRPDDEVDRRGGVADRAERNAYAMVDAMDPTGCPSTTCVTDLVVPIAASSFAVASPNQETAHQAVIAGLEIGARVADAIVASPSRRLWEPASTAAGIGGAMAAARALGLDRGRAAAALSLAVTQAATFTVRAPASLRPLRAAWISAAAVGSVLAARAGLTGPASPLTSVHGLFSVLRIEADHARILNGLGTSLRCSGLRRGERTGPWATCRCGPGSREEHR